MRVAVVGGGVAGLATAFRLRERLPDADVRVLEASPRAGGKITTRTLEGGGLRFVADLGPSGFLDNEPATLDLAERAGLRERVLRSSDDARRRYVVRGGALRRLPESPPAFLTSDLMSWRGKARVAWDLLVPRADARAAAGESVADFARRRVGAEALAAMVEPFVTGVFAGDPERLELATAFPKMAKLEREHGGLVRALLQLERARRAERRRGAEPKRTVLCSFRDGMGELPDALARALGERVWCGAEVRTLSPIETGGAPRWRIAMLHRGWETTLEADAVVLATPADHAAALVAPFAPDVAKEASAIETAPIAVVVMGFAGARPAALDGFGFLVARGEKLQILGALAESSIWSGRVRAADGAPAAGFLVRVMIGGVRGRDALKLDDDALIQIARADLAATVGLREEPAAAAVARWPAAIPQYVLGHGARVARVDRALEKYPTLHLAGASWRGVSVNDLCRRAGEIADAVAGGARN